MLVAPVFAQNYPPPPPPLDPNMSRDSLPYKLTDVMPPFNMLLKDSVTILNTFNIPKGKYIALVLFSPDCSHCDHFAEQLTKSMDSLKDIRFYMMSTSPIMAQIRDFYKRHHLERYDNIEAVGWDYQFFYITHFGTMQIPDVAIYDENKKFVELFQANITVRELYECTHRKRK